MLIPKNLFASIEAAQRLLDNPNIQRIQLAMNNYKKLLIIQHSKVLI